MLWVMMGHGEVAILDLERLEPWTERLRQEMSV